MASKAFDISDGIFFFFKRFGEKPMAALWIIACQMLFLAGLVAVSLYVMLPAMGSLIELIELDERGHVSDAEALTFAWEFISTLAATGFVLVPISIALVLMFQGAWLRFLTKGEVAAVIPFRFGGDELRLLGVNLIYIALGVLAYLGLIAVVAFFGVGLVGMVELSDHSAGAAVGSALMAFTLALAGFAVVVFFIVNLASAPALTVLDGRLRFFESWGATRDVFWHMLLVYLVVGVMIMILSMIVSFMAQIGMLGAFLPLIGQIEAWESSMTDPTAQEVFAALGELFTQPSVLIFGGLSFLIAAFAQIIFEGMWHGVGAYNACRYRGLVDGEAADAPRLDASHPAGASPSEG